MLTGHRPYAITNNNYNITKAYFEPGLIFLIFKILFEFIEPFIVSLNLMLCFFWNSKIRSRFVDICLIWILFLWKKRNWLLLYEADQAKMTLIRILCFDQIFSCQWLQRKHPVLQIVLPFLLMIKKEYVQFIVTRAIIFLLLNTLIAKVYQNRMKIVINYWGKKFHLRDGTLLLSTGAKAKSSSITDAPWVSVSN